MVQWLGLPASTAEGPGSIPGQAAKILEAEQPKEKKEEEKKNRKNNEHSRKLDESYE